MPVYRYKHTCGYEHDQMLKTDKDSVVLTCLRCGRGVTARQVRDSHAVINENHGVQGVFRRDHGAGQ